MPQRVTTGGKTPSALRIRGEEAQNTHWGSPNSDEDGRRARRHTHPERRRPPDDRCTQERVSFGLRARIELKWVHTEDVNEREDHRDDLRDEAQQEAHRHDLQDHLPRAVSTCARNTRER